MSRRRCIATILALAAAGLLVAGCGGGGSKTGGGSESGGGSKRGGGKIDTSASAHPPLDAGKSYTVTMKTNEGTFAFSLDVKDSPNTTASFAYLVKQGFFDGLTFHRIVPGFVIQGGDPKGDGTGGPGYSTVDTPPEQEGLYKKGVVAMAKAGDEPPGPAGSQFFVVTAPDAQLPPEYALLGTVTSGL